MKMSPGHFQYHYNIIYSIIQYHLQYHYRVIAVSLQYHLQGHTKTYKDNLGGHFHVPLNQSFINIMPLRNRARGVGAG